MSEEEQPVTGRVLVVDDHGDSRDLLEVMLAGGGYQVVKAATADEALDCLASQPVDMLLTDLRLPGMDGLTLVRRVRSMPATADLPIITISAGEAHLLSEQSAAAGADGFVSKPFGAADVLGAVARALKGQRPGDGHDGPAGSRQG